MKASAYFKQQAALCGIPDTDENLVKLLASSDNIEVPDTLAATLSSSLLTMDAAKNNPTLKSHFTGQALSTLDSKIEAQFAKFGFTEEEIAELKGIKSSYERVEKLTEKIAELTEKKSGGNKTVSEKAIQKLELEKAALIKQIADDKIKSENELAGFKSNFMLENILASKNWTLPEKLSATEKTRMAKILLSEKLNELGVVLTLDNDKLIPKTKENTIYYKNNQPISTENLVDQILIENGLVKVTDAPRTTRTPTPQRPPSGDPPQVKVIGDDFMDKELERQIQQLS